MGIGENFYLNLNIFSINGHIHGQTMIMCLIVFSFIFLLQSILKSMFGFVPNELLFQFIYGVAENQEAGTEWIPFLGALFCFVFVSNWLGALFPWELFRRIKLGAATNDVNTTVALALMTSIAYFYAGISKLGLKSFIAKYFEPLPFLFPLKILEDFTRPLSLRFRLFGNILADELIIAVLLSLAPILIPIPLILLGLFTSAIQALIFTTLSASYIGEAKTSEH